MIRKIIVAVALVAALFLIGTVLYVRNSPPAIAAISDADASSNKPYVVKIHAQWCPICMITKRVWSDIEDAYSGRANLVVLDFTNQANSDMSQAEARRLGLQRVFEEYYGATGTIVVVNGRTKDITAAIHGSRDFAEYRTAIDAVLNK